MKQCKHFRVKTGSCGMLHDNDSPYTCDKLVLDNKCPLQKGDDPIAKMAAKVMKPFVEKMMERR